MKFSVRYCRVIKKWWVYDNSRLERTVAFKLKREALLQAREWNVEHNVAQTVEASEPTIIPCGLTERRDEVGIHLINPDQYEIRDAIETAERDLFPSIFCHYSNVIQLKREAA